MSWMFFVCKLLSTLLNISKWNTKNIINKGSMFNGWESLSSLPDISK